MQRQHRKIAQLVFFGILVATLAIPGQAQMFGERSLGGTQGMLQGNERFLRGNRSRRDFVGADRVEQSSFVGAQQAIASGRVRSAVEGLAIEAINARRVNRPLPPLPTRGMYHPRLELDSSLSNDVDNDVSLRAARAYSQLEERIRRVGGENVEILFSESTAILRGTVDSVRTAQVLAQLLLFEPGIDNVQNELVTISPAS